MVDLSATTGIGTPAPSSTTPPLERSSKPGRCRGCGCARDRPGDDAGVRGI